jgi:hypothetical protein
MASSIGSKFPLPYTVEEREDSFVICDANGNPLAYLYYEEENPTPGLGIQRLTKTEAVAVAQAFASVPELLDNKQELEELKRLLPELREKLIELKSALKIPDE